MAPPKSVSGRSRQIGKRHRASAFGVADVCPQLAAFSPSMRGDPLCGERERYRYGMAIRVECYAGYRGEQEPLAFWLGERRLAVRAVIDRWFAPTQRWFRVEADDGNVYIIRQDEAIGDWEIAAFRCGPG